MPTINIMPINIIDNSREDEDSIIDTTFIDFNFKENESCYETSRKCLQMADNTILNNKRLVDENHQLRKTIYLMQKKIYQLNNLLFDFSYQKEVNKLFLLSFLKKFLRLGENEKTDKCPICLELLLSRSNEDVVKTSCNHLFHGTCYYQNRSNSNDNQEDCCSICRQRHVPFDIGYVNNQKIWVEHTESQIKHNLIKVMEINGSHNLPTTEEILCQIHRQSKLATKLNYY
jgi:hypothetical protein